MSTQSFNLLVGWLTITAIILVIVLLTACSAEYMRENSLRGVKDQPPPPTITDLRKYCAKVPTDSACQGAASK